MKITSWGNTFSKYINEVSKIDKSVLSYGNLNSYGDSCIPVSEDTLTIKSEKKNSNMTIGDFIQSNKQLLAGIPGKSNVTLAGAVASDVHGKDSAWNGSFINNIESLKVVIPSGESVYCDRNRNYDLFYTTVGGFGLTGTIEEVVLRNLNLNYSSKFNSHTKKGNGLTSLLNSFTNEYGEYSVAWVDLLSANKNWVINISKPLENGELNEEVKFKNYKEPPISIPFLGSNLLNTMGFLNFAFYKFTNNNSNEIKNIKDVLFPLSNVSNTKNIASKRKIIQVQFSLPEKNEDYLQRLLNILVHKQIPLLCSLKKLGSTETDLNLSFVQNGWTVAIDFAADKFNHKEIRIFYRELIALEGMVYLAKDSTLLKNEFHEMFLNFNNWKNIVKKIDPDNKYQSMMSSRLGIKDW